MSGNPLDPDQWQGPITHGSMNPLSRFIRLETEERFFNLLDRLLLVCGWLSIAVLIRELGWGGTGGGRFWPWSALAGQIIVIFFICQALLRIALTARPLHYIWRHKVLYAMALLAALTFAGLGTATRFIHNHFSPHEVRLALLALLAFSQIPLVGISLLEMARQSSRFSFRYFNAGQIFATSFALVIVTGALLLRMPNAAAENVTLSWMDAFFVSTSAVCVTGLSTVDVASTFSPLGKALIGGLIQIGGLGIMSLTYLLTQLSGGGDSLRNRYAMQSLLDEQSLSEVGPALMQIVVFTLVLETAGAALLFFSMPPGLSLTFQERLFYAVFHSVSAFCNAGFSLHSANLAQPELASNVPYLGTVMILITLGGLGFPVLRNLWNNARSRWRRQTLDERSRIVVHTQIVLLVSTLLTLGGAAFFWIESGGSPDTSLLHCLFLSVSARTAGFNTFDLSTLNIYAITLLCLLMFIGASPGGTGGGVRTTSIFILLMDVWRVIRGRKSQFLFRRKISRQVRDRALATVVLSLLVLGVSSGILRWLNPGMAPLSLFFECLSAFGTVGLSLDVTPRLDTASKFIVMLLMFTGRIGILLLVTSLVPRAPTARLDYPRGVLNI